MEYGYQQREDPPARPFGNPITGPTRLEGRDVAHAAKTSVPNDEILDIPGPDGERLGDQRQEPKTTLILNADAEMGDPISAGIPPYWANDGGLGSTWLALESASPITGDWSFKLSAAAAADGDFWMSRNFEGSLEGTATDADEAPIIPVQEGDIIRLEMAAKSDGTAGSELQPFARRWGPDKTHIGVTQFQQLDETDMEWTSADTTAVVRTGIYVVPSGTAFISLTLRVVKPTSGTAVWLADDIYMRRYLPLDQEARGWLPDGTGLEDSGAVRPLARGRQSGQNQDGDTAIEFDPAFADPPLILIKPGMSHDPVNANWSPTASYDNTIPTYQDMAALNAVGEQSDVDLCADAPSQNDSYVVSYDVSSVIVCPNPGKADRVLWIDVAIWTNDGGGWFERRVDRFTHTASAAECNDTPSSGYDTKTWIDVEKEITVGGLGPNDDVRLKIKAVTPLGYGLSGEGYSVNPHASADDPPPGVAWFTANDNFASMTPDADDYITWDALAIV
jgi:hypothetical protein